MQQTSNYNLNLPEGTDVVNPLVDYNPNFSTIDSAMKANADRTVGRATCVKSGTNHVVTRSNTGSPIINFTATGDWNEGDTMTIDSTVVSVFLPDGSAALDGAYLINSEVFGILNGTRFTLYSNVVDVPEQTAANTSYDNSESGLTATNVQSAIDELANSSTALEDVTASITQVVAHDVFRATKYGKLLILTGTIGASVPNATKILTLPSSIVVNESVTTNYVGGLGAVSATQSIPTALRINTSGDINLVNVLGLATTGNSYHVIIPIQ